MKHHTHTHTHSQVSVKDRDSEIESLLQQGEATMHTHQPVHQHTPHLLIDLPLPAHVLWLDMVLLLGEGRQRPMVRAESHSACAH